jgi:hypothetical protein
LAGATTESLHRLAQTYDDRSRAAMKMLTGIATVVVMLTVFAVLGFAVIMLAYQVYIKPLNEALEMTR